MTATASEIAELRRLTAEPTTANYTDELLKAKIEAYPVTDANGYYPADADWTATYDLASAAADVWMEKAAKQAALFDFSADGGSYSRSQAYDMMRRQAAYFLARRRPTSTRVLKAPKESGVEDD